MKTIQFTGEDYKIENLHLALGISDNTMPQQTETRVFVVNVDETELDVIQLNKDEFCSLAEQQGSVYTLEGFQKDFNKGFINAMTDEIRFYNVLKFD